MAGEPAGPGDGDIVGGMREAVVLGVKPILGLCWKLESWFCDFGFGFRLERIIKNATRTDRIPRKATPPITPPIIAGVFLLPPLLADADGREDSVPRKLAARVTLNVSETYVNGLATSFKVSYRNIIPKHSDTHRLAP